MSDDRVPVRHSLVTRLLVTSVVIALAAISATAWLAATTTTRAISHEQGGAVADERAVYEALIGYAATHHDWSGAATLVRSRAAELGRRITLTTDDRTVILDSQAGPALRDTRPSAVVDPLDVDLGADRRHRAHRRAGGRALRRADRGPVRARRGGQVHPDLLQQAGLRRRHQGRRHRPPECRADHRRPAGREAADPVGDRRLCARARQPGQRGREEGSADPDRR